MNEPELPYAIKYFLKYNSYCRGLPDVIIACDVRYSTMEKLS